MRDCENQTAISQRFTVLWILCHITFSDAYRTFAFAAMGQYGHIMGHLAVEGLQARSDGTDWDVFQSAANSQDEYTEAAVMSNISFCGDCCVLTATTRGRLRLKEWELGCL